MVATVAEVKFSVFLALKSGATILLIFLRIN